MWVPLACRMHPVEMETPLTEASCFWRESSSTILALSMFLLRSHSSLVGTILVSFCMINCLPTNISLILLKLFQATACGCAHSSACYLHRIQRFTLRPIESEDVALQLTPRAVSVTLASTVMAPSVLLLLSEHFNYPNTLRSQCIWISDFLCTVLTLPLLFHYWIDAITGLVAKNCSPSSSIQWWHLLNFEQLFLMSPLLV